MKRNNFKFIISTLLVSILNSSYVLADVVSDPVVEPSSLTNPIVVGSVLVVILVIAGFFGLKFVKNKKNKTDNSNNTEG